MSVINGSPSPGGGGAGGGKFLQYSLPPSSTFGNPQQWYFDDSLQLPEEPYCGKVVGNECYLLTKTYVLVVNLVTGVFTAYTHGLVISSQYVTTTSYSIGGYTVEDLWGNVFFSFPVVSSCNVLRINISSKIITLEPVTATQPGCQALIADKESGYLYLTGGLSNSNNTGNSYYVETATAYGHSRVWARTSVANSWVMISTTANHPNFHVGSGSTQSHISASASVGFRKNGTFYVGEFNSYSSALAYTYVYTFDGANIGTGRKQAPAFVSAPYINGTNGYCINIGGTEFKGQFIGVINGEMAFWEPETNTTYGDLPAAPVNIGNPNAVIAHDAQSELRVYKQNGIQRLYFESPVIPADRAPVLKIYKGQKYHGDSALEIKNDGVVIYTITEEWQTATEDIEIKRGQYDSAFDYRVYIENK